MAGAVGAVPATVWGGVVMGAAVLPLVIVLRRSRA